MVPTSARPRHLSVKKYKHGTNAKIDAMLQHMQDCVLFLVDGEYGLKPIAVSRESQTPKRDARRMYYLT